MDQQCDSPKPGCKIADNVCVGKKLKDFLELDYYIKKNGGIHHFIVSDTWMFVSLIECVENRHCNNSFPVCDSEANRCVGKNIIMG